MERWETESLVRNTGIEKKTGVDLTPEVLRFRWPNVRRGSLERPTPNVTNSKIVTLTRDLVNLRPFPSTKHMTGGNSEKGSTLVTVKTGVNNTQSLYKKFY